MESTHAFTPSPMQSGAMATSLPRSSDSRGATGPRENLSSGPDLGRPRCDERSTLAPFSIRYLTVGTDARMRVSSVIVLPSSGTFRSQRTRTFLPLRSASVRSPTDAFFISTQPERAATRDCESFEAERPVYVVEKAPATASMIVCLFGCGEGC